MRTLQRDKKNKTFKIEGNLFARNLNGQQLTSEDTFIMFVATRKHAHCSPAAPAEDMCTSPLFGTNSPLKTSLDFEYAAK